MPFDDFKCRYSELNDHSLFAWREINIPDRWLEPVSILADSPAVFDGGIIDLHNKPDRPPSSDRYLAPIAVTNLGLSMSLPIARFPHMAISDPVMKTPGVDGSSIAILNCLYQGRRVGIRVFRSNGASPQWSRCGCNALVFIDPERVSRIKTKKVVMSIEEPKQSTFDRGAIIELSCKPDNFLASPCDAVHVELFCGEEVNTIKLASTEDGCEDHLVYDSHKIEYRYATCLLIESMWLAVMFRLEDGCSLTIATGVEGDHIWTSGVTHQQPQSLVDIAIPTWKKFRDSSSGSDPLYWQYFRDRATYKVNDSLRFQVTIKSIPESEYGRPKYRLEISQELVPATLGQTDILSVQ